MQGRARKAQPCVGVLWRVAPFVVGSGIAGIDHSRAWCQLEGASLILFQGNVR